jgi:hypothetical protein
MEKVDTYESSLGPITPEQQYIMGNSVSTSTPKSLIAQFDDISLNFSAHNTSCAQQDSGVSSTASPSKCSNPPNEEIDATFWQRAPHDDDEPILRPTPDRFCLLPVK